MVTRVLNYVSGSKISQVRFAGVSLAEVHAPLKGNVLSAEPGATGILLASDAAAHITTGDYDCFIAFMRYELNEHSKAELLNAEKVADRPSRR